MRLTMFDIGKISCVTYELREGAPDGGEFKVVGENGVFYAPVNEFHWGKGWYQITVSGHLTNGLRVHVFDVRLLSVCLQFSEPRCQVKGSTRLLIDHGAEIVLPDEADAWEDVIRLVEYDNGGCAYDFGYGYEVWVDCEGNVVGEPHDYYPRLATILLLCNQNGRDSMRLGSAPERMLDMVRMLIMSKERDRRMIIQEEYVYSFDFQNLVEYGRLVKVAARTINRHIDSGDYHANQRKISACREFLVEHKQSIDRTIRNSDFARHLKYCVDEIDKSESTGFKVKVPKVKTYSPEEFPKTKVWWEDKRIVNS